MMTGTVVHVWLAHARAPWSTFCGPGGATPTCAAAHGAKKHLHMLSHATIVFGSAFHCMLSVQPCKFQLCTKSNDTAQVL
eukprot:782501-Amphidinium_carterae.1